MKSYLEKPWMIILAGGKATRLNDISPDLPKGLIHTKNGTVIESIFKHALKYKIDNIHFCLGHLSNAYLDYFNKNSDLGLNISYSIEKKLLGTGGAIKAALPQIKSEQIIIMNGDTFVDPEVERLILESNTLFDGAILCTSSNNASDYGLIEVEGTLIKNFQEKPKKKSGLVSTGVYLFKKESFKRLNKSLFSLEEDLLPLLNLKAVTTHKSFYDIGTPERLSKIKGST